MIRVANCKELFERLAKYHRCEPGSYPVWLSFRGGYTEVRFFGRCRNDVVAGSYAEAVDAYLHNRIAYYSNVENGYDVESWSRFEEELRRIKSERLTAACAEELDLKLSVIGF